MSEEWRMAVGHLRDYIIHLWCCSLLKQTDPENTDYAMEHGATRNFQAEKLIEEEEKKIQREREEEELNNPMKVMWSIRPVSVSHDLKHFLQVIFKSSVSFSGPDSITVWAANKTTQFPDLFMTDSEHFNQE